jgi:TadE-like protein
MRRFLFCTRGAAAVETAIFAPIFLALTLGITDLGTEMFVQMQVNAAAQSGAAYAAFNTSSCVSVQNGIPSLKSSCVSSIQNALRDAIGDANFCNYLGNSCAVSPQQPCTDPVSPSSSLCVKITARYPFTQMLPDALYSWAQSLQTISSTTTVRIQ